MKFRKRLFSFVIAIILAIFMNGTAAFNSYAATVYDVWVNGEQFTSVRTSITCGSGTAKFDASTNTLTLTNATITESMSPESE